MSAPPPALRFMDLASSVLVYLKQGSRTTRLLRSSTNADVDMVWTLEVSWIQKVSAQDASYSGAA